MSMRRAALARGPSSRRPSSDISSSVAVAHPRSSVPTVCAQPEGASHCPSKLHRANISGPRPSSRSWRPSRQNSPARRRTITSPTRRVSAPCSRLSSSSVERPSKRRRTARWARSSGFAPSTTSAGLSSTGAASCYWRSPSIDPGNPISARSSTRRARSWMLFSAIARATTSVPPSTVTSDSPSGSGPGRSTSRCFMPRSPT
jgi:hypothetical protein